MRGSEMIKNKLKKKIGPKARESSRKPEKARESPWPRARSPKARSLAVLGYICTYPDCLLLPSDLSLIK